MASEIVPLARGGVELISTCVVMIILGTIWTGLRLYARRLRKLRVQPEDYTIILALVMLWFEGIFIICMTLFGGIGHHMNELTPMNITKMFKLSYGMQFGYAIGLGLVKCSLCVTIARIFCFNPYRPLAFIAAILAICWSIATILVGILVCRPISMFWDASTPGGHCANQNAAFASVGALDVAIDVFILLIPIPMLYRLQLPRANKVGVACVFALGIFTIIVGCLRTVSIVKLEFKDASYAGKIPDLLTILELGVAIIVSCSAVLRPVFDKTFHSMRSITHYKPQNSRESSGYSDNHMVQHYPHNEWERLAYNGVWMFVKRAKIDH